MKLYICERASAVFVVYLVGLGVLFLSCLVVFVCLFDLFLYKEPRVRWWWWWWWWWWMWW